MKLVIVRNQESKGMMSKSIRFSILAKVEVTEEEKDNIAKYKLGKTILYSNMEDRGSGVLGAISRKAMAVEFDINDLINGRKIESDDILEILDLEETIKNVARNFKQILEASANFGEEDIIDL